MKRIFAFLCMIAALGTLSKLTRRERDLLPTKVHPGSTLVGVLHAAGSQVSDTSRSTVDLVFVSRNCPVCYEWIHQLARDHAAPPPTRRAVFVTDSVWSELSALAGPRVTVVAGDTSLPRAIGLRATPTLVAYETHSGRVQLIAVGRSAVDARFVPSSSVNFQASRIRSNGEH